MGYSSNWTNSNLAFIIGIIIGAKEKKIVDLVKTHYWYITIPVGMLFVELFLCKLIVGKMTSNYWILLIITELICVAFTVLIVLFAIKFDFKNIILTFIGENSFEIYMIHGLVYRFLLQIKVFDGNAVSFAVVTIGVSIMLGYLLHKIFIRMPCPSK